mgnify:CR=1 FL=1
MEIISTISRNSYDLYFVRLKKEVLFDQYAKDLIDQNDSISFNAQPSSDLVYTLIRTKNKGTENVYRILFVNEYNSSVLPNKWPQPVVPDIINVSVFLGTSNVKANIPAVGYENINADSKGSFGFDLNAYYALFGKKKLQGGFHVGASYASLKSSYSLDEYNDVLPNVMDKDGKTYQQLIYGTSVKEDFKLSSIGIPVGLLTRYTFNQGWVHNNYKRGISLGLDLGLNFVFPLYNNSAFGQGSVNYQGLYNYLENYTVLLHDLDEYDFGTYPVTENEVSTNLNTMFIQGFAGLNINIPLNNKFDLFAGPSYRFALSSMTKKTDEDYTFSSGRGNANSLLASGEGTSFNGLYLDLGIRMNINEPTLPEIFPQSKMDAIVYQKENTEFEKSTVSIKVNDNVNWDKIEKLKIRYEYNGPVKSKLRSGTVKVVKGDIKLPLPPAYELKNYYLTLYFPENFTLTTNILPDDQEQLFTDHLVFPMPVVKENNYNINLDIKEQEYGTVHLIIVDLGLNDLNQKNNSKDFNQIKSRLASKLEELFDEIGNQKFLCYVPLRADYYRIYTNFEDINKSNQTYILNPDSLFYNIKYIWSTEVINDSSLYATTKSELTSLVKLPPSNITLHYLFMDNSNYKNDFQESTNMQRLMVRMSDEYHSGYVQTSKCGSADYCFPVNYVYLPGDEYIEKLIKQKSIIESMNSFILY